MKNVVAYARFSSNNQRDESIDAQLRAIEKYAKDNDYNIIKVYADRAETGTSDKREEFQQMIQDSKHGIFESVIVHKLDRFARNKYDSVTYKRQLKINGVNVVSVTENLDGSPESVILESMLEGMAEYYSKNLAREVMKGLKETAYKAQHCGGIPPLGYDVEKETKQYVINEREAESVKIIFKRYVEGSGYNKIVKELNSLGYRTKRGKEFGKNSIYEIIGNEKYTGVYIFNRATCKLPNGKRNNRIKNDEKDVIRIDGGIPQIISKEMYQEAMKIRDENRRTKGKFNAVRVYMLTGLIHCTCCNKRFVGNSRHSGRNKTLYVTYKCGNLDKKMTCTNNKEINRDYLELYILNSLEERFFTEEGLSMIISKLEEIKKKDQSKSTVKESEIDNKIAEINVKLERLISIILDGTSIQTIKDKIKELEKEKADLEAEKKMIKYKEDSLKNLDIVKIKQIMLEHSKAVKDRDRKECKKFIKKYVKRIDISREDIVVKYKLGIAGINSVISTDTMTKAELYKKFSSNIKVS